MWITKQIRITAAKRYAEKLAINLAIIVFSILNKLEINANSRVFVIFLGGYCE